MALTLLRKNFEHGWVHIWLVLKWSWGVSRWKDMTSIDLGCISIDVFAEEINTDFTAR